MTQSAVIPDYLKPASLEGHKYGDLEYENGKFRLTNCEPVLLDFAKRVFPGCYDRRSNRIELGRSHREIQDLNWLLLRYPLNIKTDELPAALEETVGRYLMRTSGDDLKPTQPPPEFLGKLYPYQESGATFLVSNRRCILGDGMGLGKTFTALGAASIVGKYPVLIICQTQVLKQWQRVIGSLFNLPCTYQMGLSDSAFETACKRGEKLAPILHGRKPYTIPDTPFTIIHYGLLSDWEKELKARRYSTVIFDEVQELRRSESNKYSASSSISTNAEYVWGCSVGPDSIIELKGWIFGKGWVGPIEPAMVEIENYVGISNSSYIDIEKYNVESRGWTSDGFSWKKVRKFFRHKSHISSRILKIGSDSLLVTDDHSIFRAYEDKDSRRIIDCIKSSELKKGEIIPMDNGSNWEPCEDDYVDVLDIVKEFKSSQVTVDLSNVSRKDIEANPQQWQKYNRKKPFGSRLPVSLYLKNRYKLPQITGIYLGPSKRPIVFVPKIKPSSLAYILGAYIGNGWIDGGRVCFSIKRSMVNDFSSEIDKIKHIGIFYNIQNRPRGSVEIKIGGKIFSHVVKKIIHGNKYAHEKIIPGEWIINWPRIARLELLRGMTDTDGHISKRFGRRYYCTVSKILAEQLMSLLRSLGISGGIYKRSASLGGIIDGKQVIGRYPSYVVSWSGYATIGDFSGYRGTQRKFSWSDNLFNERKIRNIIECETPSFVYDLEMDGHPSFVANGALVHNSGTPIFGYGVEIWSITNALDFNCLGSKESFTREWCSMYDGKIVRDPKALGQYLTREGIMLRRKATDPDVAIDLPKVIRHVKNVEQDDDVYNGLIAAAIESAEQWDNASFQERGKISYDVERNARRAAGVSKAPFVAEFVASLIEAGEKPLVYAWHHDVHDILQDRLAAYNPAIINGRVSEKNKDRNLRRFIDDRTDAAILSLRSAAGLDGLQSRATCSVFAELDWSPAVHGQAETRIARIGVDEHLKEVPSYYCVSRSGYDEVMLDVLGVKTGQFTGLMCDEPESHEEQKRAEQMVANHIKMLIERIRKERKADPCR